MAKHNADWLIGVLPQHTEVTRVERLGADLVRVDRKKAPPAIIGVIWANPVEIANFEALLAGDPRPQFILNIPKAALWAGEAIDNLESEGVAWGKMYDLYRALNFEADLSAYRNPSLSFIERLFRQHRNVVQVERVFDQLYRLHRGKGEPVTVALTDAYEVTADAVRTAYEILAPFNVLLKNTPYGSISSKGKTAAAELGIEVCDQSSIFSRLAA
ncbi:hypothetical protein ACFPFP_20550 [Bradyrhizobium sp. GCM10023182]|uniref:Uncharacterized protein n=1 Tax=Bradyrhizobium zhengyangense TaxID=2911009 RepID=A0ABS9LQP8_9BRAD|nr:hypothetical protein [Bradyrhizobium zhengyangense]MCG2669345.1 hypothetical protein [Bradyrhizobium zhengyangense]